MKNFTIAFIFVLFFTINLIAVDFAVSSQNNGKIDRWISCDISKDWKIYDFNGNGKSDESCFYMSDKNIVYLISSETYDTIGTGKPNVWIKFSYKGKSFYKEIRVDSVGDGKIDLFRYEQNDKVYLQKRDENLDGKIDKIEEYNGNEVLLKESIDNIISDEISIDFFEQNILAKVERSNQKALLSFFEKTGKYVLKKGLNSQDIKLLIQILQPLGYNDEKMDVTYYYEEVGKISREEHDTNNDGKIDMWVKYIYNEKDGSLKEAKIEKDNNGDGKPDEWHYTDNKRRVIKIEKSTKFDGVKDYVKNY